VVEAITNLDAGGTYGSTWPPPNYPTGYTPPTPPTYPGYATPNKPVLIYCVAFGAIFETPNSAQTSAVPLLQQVAALGQTQFPSSASDPNWGFLWCTGTLSQRQQKLQTAFLKILDSSVPVALIK